MARGCESGQVVLNRARNGIGIERARDTILGGSGGGDLPLDCRDKPRANLDLPRRREVARAEQRADDSAGEDVRRQRIAPLPPVRLAKAEHHTAAYVAVAQEHMHPALAQVLPVGCVLLRQRRP
jgi:hypothetical protein